MKYFKDQSNKAHAIEEGFEYLLPAGCVEITKEEADAIANPAPTPEQIIAQTRFSSLEFLDRFTEQEQLAVVSATMTNAVVKLWYDKLLAAEFVDLSDERVSQGIDTLIAEGLIHPDRRSEILT